MIHNRADKFSDHIGGAPAHHLHAEDFFCFVMEYYFDKSPLFPEIRDFPLALIMNFPVRTGMPCALAVSSSIPARRDLRLRIHTARNNREIHRGFFSRKPLSQHNSLGAGRMGKLRSRNQITDGVDARNACGKGFIHENISRSAAGAASSAHSPSVSGRRPTAQSTWLPLTGPAPCLFRKTADKTVLRLFHRLYRRRVVNGHAPLFSESSSDSGRSPCPCSAQAAGIASRIVTWLPREEIDRGKLHADHSSADHHQMLWNFPQLKQFIARQNPRKIHPRKRQKPGFDPAARTTASAS